MVAVRKLSVSTENRGEGGVSPSVWKLENHQLSLMLMHVMEIEKEVDWLAENILAYERGLRQ